MKGLLVFVFVLVALAVAFWKNSGDFVFWKLRLARFFFSKNISRVGDGREDQVVALVESCGKSADEVIKCIDTFAARYFLMNVGPVKGRILAACVHALNPGAVVLELGAYVGYSGTLIAKNLPSGGRIISVEMDPSNVELAKRVFAHSGSDKKIKVLEGALNGGENEKLLKRLQGEAPEGFDLVFLDHHKTQYLRDLKALEKANLVRRGTVLVADNVLFPGAPDYLKYVREHFKTTEYPSLLEYTDSVEDLVTVSLKE